MLVMGEYTVCAGGVRGVALFGSNDIEKGEGGMGWPGVGGRGCGVPVRLCSSSSTSVDLESFASSVDLRGTDSIVSCVAMADTVCTLPQAVLDDRTY